MANEKFIIAVDHGTSGVKSALISVHGKVIGHVAEKNKLFLLPNGGAEQDPEEWFQSLLHTAKALVDKHLVPIEDIVALCISSQWSCTVPVDKSGHHLMNSISWLDSRGAPYLNKRMKGLINVSGYGLSNVLTLIKITGGAPGLAGKDPISHILYLKNVRPEIYNGTYKFMDSKDFLNMKLTGRFVATFDSIHLHWVTDIRDPKNIHYDSKLMKKFGIDPEKLPELIRSIDVVGELLPDIAKKIGVSPHVKVIGGSPDLHMAAIGSGAVKDFETHIYLGTSSFLICHVPFKKTDLDHNIASVPAAIPEKYIVPIEQESAGSCLTFLRDNIVFYRSKETGPHAYEELDVIADAVPAGSNKLIFTPWLYGERAPVESNTIRGGFHNMSLETTLDQMVRAVFEGVAYNTRWVLGVLENFTKQKLDPLRIVGGGAVSDVWCQIYADVLNRTIQRVKDPIRANAKGAAFVAAVGMGFIKFEDVSKYCEIDRTFTPNLANREIYDQLFCEFVEIYKRTAPIYKRLNEIKK